LVGLGIPAFAVGGPIGPDGIGPRIVDALSLKEVIGFLAGFGTTFAAFPDLIAMLRHRSSQGMNPRMAAIMGAFQVLWIWYGLLIESLPVIVWNSIAVVINVLVVGTYLFYARVAEKPAGG
jgi:MtN3 and saliva related transmembrane protein